MQILGQTQCSSDWTADIARATENRIWVIRADVAGRNGNMTSLGCSEIVNPEGDVAQEARLEDWDLLVADIDVEERGLLA